MPIEKVPTFCRVCEASCGLVAERQKSVIMRLGPDKSHPISKGYCCPKGLLALDMHQDEDRLNHPLKRTNPRSEGLGEFEVMGWNQTVDEIAHRLRNTIQRYGKNAVSVYLGNPTAFNSSLSPSVSSFAEKIGFTRIFCAATQDCSNKFAASEAVFGSSTLHPIPDIENTDYLLIIGGNPKVSNMSFICISNAMSKLKAAKKRGAKILHINPRKIESSAGTGEVVQIRPDTDLYFLAALLFEIDRIGGFREELIKAHGKHIDGLRGFIKEYSPDRVEKVVGISSQQLRDMANDFSSAEKASVYMSTGVNMGRQGALCYWLLQMLSFVTGNLDKSGGNLYTGGAFPVAAAGRAGTDDPFFDSPFGPLRAVSGFLPSNLMADMINQEEDPIRALFVISGNPLLSMGGEERLRKAFEKLDLLVVLDIYRNASGEMADYLLPCADMLERSDINLFGTVNGFQPKPFVQFTNPVVPPQFDRKEQWWILSRIQQAMGFDSALDDQQHNPYHETDQMLSIVELSIDKLKTLPSGTAVLGTPRIGSFYSDNIQTEDKKVDCCPPLFTESIQRAENIFQELHKEPEDRLKLISLRNNVSMINSWYHNLERREKGRVRSNPIYLNPEDAERRGLVSGARVRLSNQWGAIEAEIQFDDRLRQGVVAMAHGWGNQLTPGMKVAQKYPGVNVNQLLPTGPGSYEKISNQSHMTGIPVSIEKI